MRIRNLQGVLLRSEDGQSLFEVAMMLPMFVLLMAYAIDFGYFFLAAANITSAARNATQYSIMGYEAPAQSGLAAAGPIATVTSVSSLALADMGSLANSSTTTAVQVCSKAIGTTGNVAKCSSYGASGGGIYGVGTDPEAPVFYMHRVDVTYTVQPPVPLSFFSVSLLPNLTFHRQVSMREMD